MGKKPVSIEWRFDEERRDPFGEAVAASPIPTAGETATITGLARRKRLFWLALILLLMVALPLYLWQRANLGVIKIDDELRKAGEVDLWLVNQGNILPAIAPEAAPWRFQFQREDSTLIAFRNEEPASSFVVEWHLHAIHDQLARVDLATHSSVESLSYHQTRFYRQAGDGWLRTSPDADLWGAPHRLESKYFVFEYRQEDEDAVAKAAPKVDSLYTTLRANFALASEQAATKQVIEVSVLDMPGAALSHISHISHVSGQDRWRVPSPALYLAPSALEMSDLLLQSIAFSLINRTLAEALQQVHLRSPWGAMVEPLRLWQLWNLDLPLSAWRADLVKWRFNEIPKMNEGKAPTLPDDYLALCALHSLWLVSPAQVGIPLTCGDEDRQPSPGALASLLYVGGSPNLSTVGAALPTDLSPLPVAPSGLPWPTQPGDTVSLETLFEYIESAYGRQGMVTFLAAMGEYDDWESLSKATFGISSAQLMAGWRADLAQRDQ